MAVSRLRLACSMWSCQWDHSMQAHPPPSTRSSAAGLVWQCSQPAAHLQQLLERRVLRLVLVPRLAPLGDGGAVEHHLGQKGGEGD